jgi:hypothetical protein
LRKTFVFRLFGIGKLPRKYRPIVEDEGVVLMDEGVPGWLITRNVHGPGKRARYRAEGFSGCLVLTQKRLLGFSYWKRQINIGLDDPRMAKLHVAMPRDDVLSISFEAAEFRPGWQGVFEFRFRTDQARGFQQALVAHGAPSGVIGH